jgi:hypothetical protein
MLYPIIWPWGLLYDSAQSYLCDRLIPNPHAASSTTWVVIDGLAGAFYIIVGTLWIWFLGKIISLAATRVLGKREIQPNQAIEAIGGPRPPQPHC